MWTFCLMIAKKRTALKRECLYRNWLMFEFEDFSAATFLERKDGNEPWKKCLQNNVEVDYNFQSFLNLFCKIWYLNLAIFSIHRYFLKYHLFQSDPKYVFLTKNVETIKLQIQIRGNFYLFFFNRVPYRPFVLLFTNLMVKIIYKKYHHHFIKHLKDYLYSLFIVCLKDVGKTIHWGRFMSWSIY